MKIYDEEKKEADERRGHLSELSKKLKAREVDLEARRQNAERHTATLKREDEAIEAGDLRIVEMLESSPSRCSEGGEAVKNGEAGSTGGECANCSLIT